MIHGFIPKTLFFAPTFLSTNVFNCFLASTRLLTPTRWLRVKSQKYASQNAIRRQTWYPLLLNAQVKFIRTRSKKSKHHCKKLVYPSYKILLDLNLNIKNLLEQNSDEQMCRWKTIIKCNKWTISGHKANSFLQLSYSVEFKFQSFCYQTVEAINSGSFTSTESTRSRQLKCPIYTLLKARLL